MPVYQTHIKPQGKILQDFWDSDAPVQVIRGPLGSSKTTLTCNKILHLMTLQKPNKNKIRLTRWVCVRNTYSELFSTSIKDWLEINGHLGIFKEGGAKPPCHYLDFKLPDNTKVKAEMIFLSFDRPQDTKKAKGLQLTGVWLNEMSQLPKSAIDMLDLRHGRFPSRRLDVNCSWHGMIGDTNSFDTDHWLFKIFDDVPEDWATFSQPGGVIKVNEKWIENPYAENLSNLPKDYYKRGQQGKSDAWIKLNLANEYGFVSDGLPVHPQYQDSVHCIDIDFIPNINKPIILGADFGRTPAVMMMQETIAGGYIVFDEFVSIDMSAAIFAPELYKYINHHYSGYKLIGYGDPSGEQKGQATEKTVFKVFNAAGIPLKPTHPSNDITHRRTAVALPLTQLCIDGKPRIIILPKAKTLRKGLAGGFCFKRIQIGGEEKYHNQPDKNKYSHIVEAFEYAMVGMGEGTAPINKANKSPYDNWDTPVN